MVKCSLRGLLLGSPEQKDAIIQAIQERVAAYSKRVVGASIALGLLTRELFHEARTPEEARTVTPPDVKDITLLRQLMLWVDGTLLANDQKAIKGKEKHAMGMG